LRLTRTCSSGSGCQGSDTLEVACNTNQCQGKFIVWCNYYFEDMRALLYTFLHS